MFTTVFFYNNINNKKSQSRALRAGFTIVELLIVIVVIAILAAVTVVAYNGVSNRAVESALKSDLTTMAKQLQIDKIKSGSSIFPATLEEANGGKGIDASATANVYYSTRNDSQSFCLTAVSTHNISIVFSIDDSGIIGSVACEEHDVAGEEGGFDTFTWERIGESVGNSNDGLATNYDGSIVYRPHHPTGSNGPHHIKKSVDGGQSWTVLENTLAHTWGQIRTSRNGQTILASYMKDSSDVAFTGGVTWSHDGGVTWSEHQDVDLRTITRIELSGNGQVMMASGGLTVGGSGSFMSNDSGETWRSIDTRARGGMALSHTGQRAYFSSCVSYNSRLLTSTDGGISWANRTDPPICLDYMKTSFDGQIVWATNNTSHMWKSEDGGVSWSLVEVPNPNSNGVSAIKISENGKVIVIHRYESRIYVSKDYGSSWEYYSTPDGSSQGSRFVNLISVSGNGRVIYANNANNLYKGVFE